ASKELQKFRITEESGKSHDTG
ncbi:hypothetical protein LCGC14_2424580, partial [marine sediment metagenome]